MKLLSFIKVLFVLCTLIMLEGCPFRCESVTITYPDIPHSILSKIPYYDKQSIGLTSTISGLNIEYSIDYKILADFDQCPDCCSDVYVSQNHVYSMTPNYPFYDISLSVSNADTTRYDVSINVGGYFFSVPLLGDIYSIYQNKVDSVVINNRTYTHVFLLKRFYTYYPTDLVAYPDSLYFNFNDGIIQLILSDGQTYIFNR